MPPLPAVAVLYTIKPDTGDDTGVVILEVDVKATLGGKNPRLGSLISNFADEFGAEVPMPTFWARNVAVLISNKAISTI